MIKTIVAKSLSGRISSAIRNKSDPFADPTQEVKDEIERLMKDRRLKDYRSVASLDVHEIWHRKYCQTFDDLKSHMEVTTQAYRVSIASLRTVISNLTYWDDPTPGIEGLSVIGSYAWLVASALQHFFDSESEFYQEHVEYTKLQYQNLAAAAEIFLESADDYFQHVNRMRIDGQMIVKKLVDKWKLQDSDPLINHPLLKPNRRRPRRHIGNGLDFEQDVEEDENFFHLQLNHQKIVCSPKDSSEWIPFSELHPKDKVDICQMYLQSAEDVIENATEDIGKITGEMGTIEIKGSAVRSQAREITGAMRHFAKTYKRTDALDAEEQKRISHLLEAFWVTLDRLHDDSYALLRLAQETRDIIRTCYIYLDAFYKCDMPDYDNFLLCIKNRKDKQDRKKAIKGFWDKLVTYNHEHTKLSEVMKFLTLSDFTMSIYQLVVAKHAIQVDGISMKIGSYDEPSEPWGLIGTDARKTCPHRKKSKSTPFKDSSHF